MKLRIEGKDVEISHPERVLWPRLGFTKGDLASYYESVAPAVLAHLAGRPLTFVRAPGGIGDRWWYQTECPHPPRWVATAPVPGARGDRVWDYCVVNDAATLLWLANLGCVELHPLLATADDLERATMVVFDLDPGIGTDLVACCRVALALRAALDRQGLEAFIKTSGAVGIHVVVPLTERATFDSTRSFARALARDLTDQDPDLVTDRMAKAGRVGKVFIDWQQNGPYKSLVAPYSLRLLDVPLVSTPLLWSEVEQAVMAGDERRLVFDPARALARLRRDLDPWADMWSWDQGLR